MEEGLIEMSILNVNNMTQGFGERTIFNNVSFELRRGEHIGLVGGNGEGKSTFMQLITKNILPEQGTIEWNSKATIGYMDQNVLLKKEETVRQYLRGAFKALYDMEAKLEKLYTEMTNMNQKDIDKSLKSIGRIQEALELSDFYSIESKIEGLADGLGIKELLDRSTDDLSGGQRSKIILGKLLLEKPDILLLDEPTNHLDEENIDWFKGYLKSYDKAFILISHDDRFLNDVTTVIYHLENKTLTRYNGNYDKFLKLYEERKIQRNLEYNKQQKEIKKLEEYIRKNKVRASTAAMAKSREKQLNKINRIEINKNRIKPHFDFLEAKQSASLIFETKNLVIGYDKPLTKKLNLLMRRGEKIALCGANGIGKTTLLKSLMGIIAPVEGKVTLGEHQYIGYFEQEVKRQTNEITALEDMWSAFPNGVESDIRRKLARCGLTHEHIYSPINKLSGGEQAKVRLCKLINKKTNILILDEPTNHLDVDAKKELKKALKEYSGSIILVCHEREFYKDIVNEIWNCENWALKKLNN